MHLQKGSPSSAERQEHLAVGKEGGFMMKLLILGGTGVISREIVRAALREGMDVTLFNRGSRSLEFAGDVHQIRGDRRDAADFERKLHGVKADVVIDMISFDAQDARQTLYTLRDQTGQFIFTSSIAAYRRPYRSLPIREDDQALCEDPVFPYAYQKAQMERALLEQMACGAMPPITIIRPSLTFGVGCANIGVLRQNSNIVSRMRAGKPLVMLGEGVAPWSFTFTPDLARGFIACCGNEKAYNTDFHITNTELTLWEDLYRTIGALIGCEPKFAYLPSEVLKEADFGLFAHFYYEKKYASVFSNEKIFAAAPAYRPQITLRDGMEQILAWWESQGMPVDPRKDAMEDQLCSAYARFKNDVCQALRQ